MAKLICSKSGLSFNVEHLHSPFLTSTYEHPMFHVPQHRLISLAGAWAAQKMSAEESYLLYLSLLDSTSLIKWRSPASFTPTVESIVASNMTGLLSIISKINLIKHPSFTLPSFVISGDTANLSNSGHWIQSWITNYHEWYDSYLDSHTREELKEKLDFREEALQRLIKSAVPTEKYAGILAEWAAIAGEFPTHTTPHYKSGQPVELRDYWKHIIRSAADDDKIWQFPRADIVELIDHCEDKIKHGNIYAHKLMAHLRSGLRKYDDYCGFGDLDIAGRGTLFTVMNTEDTSVYDTNIAAIKLTAPVSEPKKHQYKTHFEWLKAWTKWKVASPTAKTTQ